VLGFPEYDAPGRRLAAELGVGFESVAVHRFPDGESLVRLPARLPESVVLCRSLDRPNTKLIELFLAAATARELGARTVTLVAPYLCYMRQDTSFHPGEAVGQRIIGRLLADAFEGLVTVDPHLHRVHRLQDAVPASRSVALTATGPMAAFLDATIQDPLLVGPDAESEQWVAEIAGAHGYDYVVGRKRRLGDRRVEFTLPDRDCGSRHVVLVDDVASTGRTLEAAARAVALRGPAEVSALVAHAIFEEGALQRLTEAGVTKVWSTDSVIHPTNAIELAPLIAGELISRAEA